MLSPAPMPFSPFSSSARSLKFRGTCATAMIADVGGSGSFRSVMARFCRGKAGVAVSSMGKRTKLSVFVVAQVVGAGVGGGLMACSAGHEPAIRSNAKPWTHGMVGSWLAEQPSPGFQVLEQQPEQGPGLVILHPCVSLDNDDQAPSSSSSGQQLAKDLLSFPFTSRLQHQRAFTSLTSHLNKLTLSCNGDIKKHILEMPS